MYHHTPPVPTECPLASDVCEWCGAEGATGFVRCGPRATAGSRATVCGGCMPKAQRFSAALHGNPEGDWAPTAERPDLRFNGLTLVDSRKLNQRQIRDLLPTPPKRKRKPKAAPKPKRAPKPEPAPVASSEHRDGPPEVPAFTPAMAFRMSGKELLALADSPDCGEVARAESQRRAERRMAKGKRPLVKVPA